MLTDDDLREMQRRDTSPLLNRVTEYGQTQTITNRSDVSLLIDDVRAIRTAAGELAAALEAVWKNPDVDAVLAMRDAALAAWRATQGER